MKKSIKMLKKVLNSPLGYFALGMAGMVGIVYFIKPKTPSQSHLDATAEYIIAKDGLTIYNRYGKTFFKIDILPFENRASLLYERKEHLDLKITRFCLTDFGRDGIVDVISKNNCQFVRAEIDEKDRETMRKVFTKADECLQDYTLELSRIIEKAENCWNQKYGPESKYYKYSKESK